MATVPRKYAAASAVLASAWTEPHRPKLGIDGSKAKLTHPFGHAVSFDLHRSDLADPARLAQALSGPLGALRDAVANQPKLGRGAAPKQIDLHPSEWKAEQ
jgi:hypothetical protein